MVWVFWIQDYILGTLSFIVYARLNISIYKLCEFIIKCHENINQMLQWNQSIYGKYDIYNSKVRKGGTLRHSVSIDMI